MKNSTIAVIRTAACVAGITLLTVLIVLIGRHVPSEVITQGLLACLGAGGIYFLYRSILEHLELADTSRRIQERLDIMRDERLQK